MADSGSPSSVEGGIHKKTPLLERIKSALRIKRDSNERDSTDNQPVVAQRRKSFGDGIVVATPEGKSRSRSSTFSTYSSTKQKGSQTRRPSTQSQQSQESTVTTRPVIITADQVTTLSSHSKRSAKRPSGQYVFVDSTPAWRPPTTYAATASLDGLPADVLLDIFSMLDWRDLLAVQSSCRRLRSVASEVENYLWRHHCFERGYGFVSLEWDDSVVDSESVVGEGATSVATATGPPSANNPPNVSSGARVTSGKGSVLEQLSGLGGKAPPRQSVMQVCH
eukprot:Opistho-2@84300